MASTDDCSEDLWLWSKLRRFGDPSRHIITEQNEILLLSEKGVCASCYRRTQTEHWRALSWDRWLVFSNEDKSLQTNGQRMACPSWRHGPRHFCSVGVLKLLVFFLKSASLLFAACASHLEEPCSRWQCSARGAQTGTIQYLRQRDCWAEQSTDWYAFQIYNIIGEKPCSAVWVKEKQIE